MNGKPESADDYLAGLPDEARGALEAVRAVIKDVAPDAEETISYGIPLYKQGGKHLIGFGASKRHLSLYVTNSAVLREYERELAPFDRAGTKTTIRFTADNPLPAPLLRKIVELRTRELGGG
jgi:uncharacterized protein YdhG (YjbR/CyaY superfamily)